jgi:hypothetical protein
MEPIWLGAESGQKRMNAPQQTASFSIASSTQSIRADNLNTLILPGLNPHSDQRQEQWLCETLAH